MKQDNLLSLQFHSSPEDLSSFLVIQCPEPKPEHLDIFTPVFMEWTEGLWIFDLKSCRSYWQAQAREQQVLLPQLLLKFIAEYFPYEFSEEGAPRYRACLCPHPWLGILILRQMKDRKLSDFMLWEAPLTQSLFKSISWRQWLAEAQGLTEVKYRGDKQKKSQQLQFLRSFGKAMQRLALKSPWGVKEMPASSLQRRYGALVARCWSWTYPDPRDKAEQLSLFDLQQSSLYDLQSFPWVNYEIPSPPASNRILEYPLNDWDFLEPLLIEDLDKICHHPQFSSHFQVCELQWKILLYNFKELLITVGFHSPHPLHQEIGSYKTALHQFYYAYTKAMKDLSDREDDLDLPEQIPFLSWELAITKKLSQPPQLQELIPSGKNQTHSPALQELSNKLPAPIQSYSLYPDFCPERGFETSWQAEEEELLESWRCAAKKRPLFVFKCPKRVSRPTIDGSQQFLERSSETWWEKKESSFYFRDYFLVQNKSRQWLWVYRTSEGRWFQHGIYS